jgi:hypothetical protein
MIRNRLERLVTAAWMLVVASLVLFASDVPYEGWKTVETEQFSIIFEPKDMGAAMHVASFADSVYHDLAGSLLWPAEGRIPVVIAGRTPWANGCYSPFPATIVLYVTSPEDRFLGSRTADWLKTLFVHELTHCLHLGSPVGPAKYLSRIFGPAVTAMNIPFMEGWWVEGISTYTETAFSEGGRGDSSLFALTYEAPQAEDRLWSLSQGAYQGPWAPSGRIYVTGYLMVDYLVDTYGPEIFRDTNGSFAWFPFLGVSHTLRQKTGYDANELFSFALAARKPSVQSTVSTPFSPEAKGDFFLPVPAGSSLLGLSRTTDRGGELVSWGPDGMRPVVRLPISDPDALAVSRDGKQVVFSMTWTDETDPAGFSLAPVGYADLYRYETETGRFRQLTERQQLFQPALDRSGSRLAALQRIESRYRLATVDLHTKEISVLYDDEDGSVYEPEFSPDGNLVVAVEIVAGRSALAAIDLQGNRTVLVGFREGEIRNPRFLDDGDLLFSSDERGRFELYRYSFADGSVYRILSDSLGILGAVSDSDRLVLQTYSSDGYRLRTVQADAVDPVPVTIAGERPVVQEPGSRSLSVEPYRDLPRFNLVLPLPAETADGRYVPGIWTHFSSVLRRHRLEAQLGYDPDEPSLLGQLGYRFSPGPYTLDLSVSAERSQMVGEADLSVLLRQHTGVRAYSRLSTDLALYAETGVYQGAAVQASYQVSRRPVAKDFFGSSNFGAYIGSVFGFLPAEDEIVARPFGGVRGGWQIPRTHVNLGLDVDAVLSPDGSTLLRTLPFATGLYGSKDGEAKALLTLFLQLPLGLFDRPIPYGGLTAMGLSFSAMTAVYRIEGVPVWEDDLYLSARLSAKLTMGSSAVLEPYAGVVVSPFSGICRLQFGMDGVLQVGSGNRFPWH